MRKLRATEADTTIKLRNLLEYEFITSLYVGTHLQEMTFIIDTGSDLTWLPTEDCPKHECPRDNYHYHKSSAFKKTSFMSSIKYVIGEAKGILMSDHFSLKRSNQNTIRNLEFLGVYETKNLESFRSDGLLGLGPKKKYKNGKLKSDQHVIVE